MKLGRIHIITAVMFLSMSACRVSFGVLYDDSSPAFKSHAHKAKELRDEGKLEDSILEYEAHIQARLEEPKRDPEENPYFYYLLIGDTYLEMNQTDHAEEAYQTAKAQGVDDLLVKDRFRQLGKWYEEREDYEAAIDLFTKYRELDPLLFDMDIDRNHKKMVKKEQGQGQD